MSYLPLTLKTIIVDTAVTAKILTAEAGDCRRDLLIPEDIQ
jgi:hypothetical protein